MKNRPVIFFAILMLCLAAILQPGFGYADTLSSSHYQLLNPQFSVGAGSASSAHYGVVDAVGGQTGNGTGTSSHYNGFWGFFKDSYPGVPGIPTLTNTGGSLYNALDFVVNTGHNTSDVNYAIAVSSDNFATTSFVQAGDTLGSTAVWQSYIAWGSGSGQRLSGLNPNTTYQMKIKARYGTNTETAYSLVASATTSSSQLTFSVSGVPVATNIGSVTTTIGTSSSAMSFSTLPVGSAVIAAQQVTVSTNASGGYTTTLAQDGNLRQTSGSQIQPVTATNAAPAPWPTAITSGAFGYHTTDASLCTGVATRFAADDTYAAATSTPTEVACSTGPTSGSVVNTIVYKLQIGTLQQAGTYSNIITYVTTAVY